MRKIKKITTELQSILLKTPFVTALRRVENVEFVRVCILFDDGTVSCGEAPSTKAITGEDLESITQDITSLAPSLYGLSPKEASVCVERSSLGSSAKASLDMALFFVEHPLSFHVSMRLKTDITISYNETQTMLNDAQKAYNEGFDFLKIKLASDINHAIQTTLQLRKMLPKSTLLIDANQAWNLEDTLTYIDATKGCDLALIEQPVQAKEIENLGIITRYSQVPILADEAVFNLDDVRYVMENGYADMINIKLMKCGGVTKAIEILEYARAHQVPCMLGSMLEGPISINAAVYLAERYSDVIKYADLDSPLLYAS